MSYAEVYRETTRQARKEYYDICGVRIRKGEKYCYASGICEGDPFDFKVNLAIKGFIDEINSKTKRWDDHIHYSDLTEVDWTKEEMYKLRKIFIDTNSDSLCIWSGHRLDQLRWAEEEREYRNKIKSLEEQLNGRHKIIPNETGC